MFNSVSDDPKNELLQDRLARLADQVRLLELSTREEYQAEVYSRVNAILAMGVGMTPLFPITAEGPAVLGDLIENLSRLNKDGADIAGLILRIEDTAASLYNLAASSQNSLRQQIRELALASNLRRYVEPFVNTQRLDSFTASIDQDAGVAALPLTDETEIVPDTIIVGQNSIGTQTSGAENLTDDRIETAMVWAGEQLELIIRFAKPEIINRLKIEMDDYQGLEIVTLETSPDGTAVEDILAGLGVTGLHLNGIQSKYSGDFILDFDPRHAQSVRIVFQDRVDVANIALRSLQFYRRRYSAAGRLVTTKIDAPTGTVVFTTDQRTTSPLTSITHQISYNGVHFQVIQPGDKITLKSNPFWYGAVLERSSSRFNDAGSPVEPTTADPLASTDFVLAQSNFVPLGNGVIERTLYFSSVTGPILLRETPLQNTLVVQEGSVQLDTADYAFAGNILSFDGDRGGITVTYQTSALGPTAIKQREEYYTPLLFQAQFEKD